MRLLIEQVKLIGQQNIKNIDHFSAEPNSQKGSNPGAIFHDPDSNEKHYVKFYHNDQQARSEVAAAKIYEHLGAKTLEPKLVSYRGKIGVSSKWNPHMKDADWDNLSDNDLHDLSKHFHAAVLTGNHDFIGMDRENIARDSSTGNLHSVDAGGTFNFRAQGGPKNYSGDINDYKTLRDPKINWQAHSVTKQLQPHHLQSIVPHLQNLTPEVVRDNFKEMGLQDYHEKTNNLMLRKNKLLNLY